MSKIFICGTGAVSPGWGMESFRTALERGEALPTKELARTGNTPITVRQVPPATPRPAFLAHARFRRTSPIAQYAVSAALEALGADAAKVTSGEIRLGIIFCSLTGCVNYSKRFYGEVLSDPSTASPLVFPETVYNAPASHLGALLGTTSVNYTLVGDPGTFIQGLVLAADWLTDNRVDGCLVIGAEEMDGLTATAIQLFERKTIFSDGAGAIYLCRSRREEALSNSAEKQMEPPHVGCYAELKMVTNSHLFSKRASRAEAIMAARQELKLAEPELGVPRRTLLCDGLQGVPRADRDEQAAWSDWTGARRSVKRIFGEALMASTAWQCVAAVDAIAQKKYDAATVSVAGTNQQAIAAQFITCNGGM